MSNRKNIIDLLSKVTNKIRSFDRYALICLITGVIFFLLGTVQLVLMLLTPTLSTFDHISVVILDFIVVALCLVYVLYKSGRIDHLLPEGIKDIPVSSEKDSGSRAKAVSGAPERPQVSSAQSAPDFFGMGHIASSAQSGNRRRRSGSPARTDESLISPRHRYSQGNADRKKSVGFQKRTQDVSSSHPQNSNKDRNPTVTG